MRRTTVITLAALAILGFTFGAQSPGSAAVRATHARIAETSKQHPSSKGHGTPLTKGETLDAKACNAIANDMLQAANADVTKSEAQSFVNATKNALKKDKRASQLQKLAR